jgi:N-acetylmuramoyl-L-alanine amidase
MPDSEIYPGNSSFRPKVGMREISKFSRQSQPLRRASAMLLAALVLLAPGKAAAQAPTAPALRFVVVLDAAHGGTELGGHLGDASQQASQTQQEKNYTLALSVRLRSLLAARGISVVTTRESDTVVDADRRAEIANRANAQACLSLHASQSGTGIHIYASSLAPAEPNMMLAWKTAQAAWVTRSLALAGVLNSSLSHAGLNVGLGRTDLPTIDCMACPALAIEIGKENSQDKSQSGFDNAEYQTRIAQALAAAILEWKTNGWRTNAAPAEAARP